MEQEVIQQGIPGYVIAIMDIAIAISVFAIFFWVSKWRYEKTFQATKKHPHGQLICEFHPESGFPYSEVLPIEDNGGSVKALAKRGGQKKLDYRFNKAAMETIKYPANPMLGLTLLQVDAPKVMWWENEPNPITRNGEGCIITAERLHAIQDDATLDSGNALTEELNKSQEELRRAVNNRLDRRMVYVLLGIAAGGAVGGAIFAYQCYQLLSSGVTP